MGAEVEVRLADGRRLAAFNDRPRTDPRGTACAPARTGTDGRASRDDPGGRAGTGRRAAVTGPDGARVPSNPSMKEGLTR